jgi:hypothetical protein
LSGKALNIMTGGNLNQKLHTSQTTINVSAGEIHASTLVMQKLKQEALFTFMSKTNQ